jgi:crotonobetainyl-CoA:carnitine CoA-transferase CaiB-like acyl-CoA transferase
LPLHGVRVLDLTRFVAGPLCTFFLASLGAEVISVEDVKPPTSHRLPPFALPDGGSATEYRDGAMSVPYLKRGRGKRSVAIALATGEGRDLLRRLADTSAVFVENARPGAMAAFGLGYHDLSVSNPGLVYCSISGYGQTGPDAGVKAYDPMAQAAAGLMSLTGDPDGPPMKAGSALADTIAGTFAFAGILAALLHRSRSGEGQHVDVSMVDCLLALVLDESPEVWPMLGLPVRQGNRLPRGSPFNVYPTTDGWIVIGTASDAEWSRLLDAIDRMDLKADANLMSRAWRIANNGHVDAVIAGWTRERATAEAVARLRIEGVACGPVRDIDALKTWPQLAARGMLEPLRHPTLGPWPEVVAPGFPLKFGSTEVGYATPAPLVGSGNDAIWGDLLGFDVAALRMRGVI